MAKRSDSVDRLSYLPRDLLHHILSFLPTQYVVQTCLLSKHWRTIWCSIPSLYFDNAPFNDLDRFVEFVNSALLLRDGSTLHQLRLALLDMHSYVPKINKWIIYAIRHNVQVFDMKFSRHEEEEEDDNNGDGDGDGAVDATIKFTPHIFNCLSMREFKYYSNNEDFDSLKWSTSVRLPALKTLYLEYVCVEDGQLLEGLISEAPSLETLILDCCRFYNRKLVTISSCQLKNLNLKHSTDSPIAIYAPNLLSFKCISYVESPTTLEFNGELFSLVEAVIDMRETCIETLVEVFRAVRNARSLKLILSSCYNESIADDLHKDLSILHRMHIPFSILKHLGVGTEFFTNELILINNILKHCPEIENVFFASNPVTLMYTEDPNEHCEAENMWFNFKFYRLKSVEFQTFRGSINEVKMLKFLLENATVLEKLIVIVEKSQSFRAVGKQEMLKFGRELLTYPRASSSVEILFMHNLNL